MEGLNPVFQDVFQYINLHLQFREEKVGKEFFYYNQYQQSVMIMGTATIVFGFVFSPFESFALYYGQTYLEICYACVQLILSLVLTGHGWLILKSQLSTPNRAAVNTSWLERSYLAFCYSKFLMLSLRSYFVTTCSIYPTTLRYLLFGWQCHQLELTDIDAFISSEMLLFVVLPPIMVVLAMHQTNIQHILLWLVINSGTIFVTTTVLRQNWSFTLSHVVWTTLAFVVVIDIFLQKVGGFLIHRKYKTMYYEQAENAMKDHANELKQMIGNVAHDIKTPLASFTIGLNTITYLLNKVEESILSHKEDDTMHRLANVDVIRMCVKTVQNANAFMLMNMNRNLDYAKLQSGFKLMPQLETFSLAEVLRISMQCIQDMQDNIVLELQPVSNAICSQIVTDKQWLQENILCLLSNAVKYSTEGVVKVRVLLETLPLSNEGEEEKQDDAKNGDDDPAFETNRCVLQLQQKRSSPALITLIQQAEDTATAVENHATNAEKKPNEKMYLKIEVEDHGVGLSTEAIKSLFHPAKQAERFEGGTGLGLYSLAKRIEALQGMYGAQSKSDGTAGSLFWFRIPYLPDHSTAAAVATTTPSASFCLSVHDDTINTISSTTPPAPQQLQPPSQTPPLQQKAAEEKQTEETEVKNAEPLVLSLPPPAAQSIFSPLAIQRTPLNILLVDDAPTILKLTSMLLTKRGHVVHTAGNGAIAVEKVQQWFHCHHNNHCHQQQQYDVIIMDLQMPVMDGLQATKTIRAFEQAASSVVNQHSLIIGMSANSDYDTMQAAFAAGVDDFMGKPFDITLFFTILHKLQSASSSPSPTTTAITTEC